MLGRDETKIARERPENSSAVLDTGIKEATGLKPKRPWQSLQIDALRRRWQEAAGPSQMASPFEELTLDHLGTLADNMALLQWDDARAFTIVKAGKVFEAWIGCAAEHLGAADLSVDRARALQELLGDVVHESRPVQTVAYGVVDGLVCVYDLVAVPLANRQSPSSCLVYLQERERNFSLVEALFQATDEGLAALAVIRDASGVPCDFLIAALNEGAARFLGGTVESLRGRCLTEICASFPASGLPARILAGFHQGGSDRFEIDCLGELGRVINLRISIATTGDLVAMTLTDVSDLKAREESFRLLFEGNPVPMFLCDTGTLAFLAVNEAAIAHYGYDRGLFLTLTLLDIVPQTDRENIRHAIGHGLNLGGGPTHPWQHVKADGTPIDVLTYWQATTFQDRHAELVAVMDVTEKRRAEKRIDYMAHHDALTGLPNRVLFHERLDSALPRLRRHDEKLAVLYLDLDHFKTVNDTLGHPIGDLLLKATAERLRQCLRDCDTVARFGGDEFAVLQMGIAGPYEASALAERIVTLLSEPYDIDGQRIVIGASAGIALAPADGETSELLLKNADMALYRAKEDGRRLYRFFEPGMDHKLRTRRAMELELRKALAGGEFELYYQPLVTAKTGAVSGFEALLRWRNSAGVMVPPAEFIPLAEEIGLIMPLGEWVLRQACLEAASWPGDLKVAVNLSPVQFRDGNLPGLVASALASAGLPAARLELEVTETILLQENKTNLATLHQLQALGVRISMDDFGTGYSGMSYLRAFSFDKIKIDRSFVSELAETGDCMAIVRAITRLAASLGIRTTAEGVETERQLSLLCQEGCTEMQGYLLSRPIPASEISQFLATRSQGWLDALGSNPGSRDAAEAA